MINIAYNPALIRATAIGVFGIIFITVIGFGIRSGYRRAQSSTVYRNTGELAKALDYFRQDNDRFPSATEFADQNSFGRYLATGFPVKQLSAGACQQSYDYILVNPQDYALTVCLSSEVEGAPAGVTELSP
jgi:hypothetical protein